MHKIYALKDALCDELEKYGDKEITAGTLEIVDTLAHALKNVNRIISDYEEDEYSQTMGNSYRNNYGDMSYRGSYDDGSYRGNSYARGRGRNAKRDSMGRYSRAGNYSGNDYSDQLHEMMNNTDDENIRQEIQRLAQKMERM